MVPDGGNVSSSDVALTVSKANAATLYISIGTNFKNYQDIKANPVQKAEDYLNSAQKKTYILALNDHVAAFSKMFGRVKLDLGTTDSIRKPTNVRVKKFAKANDPQMAALYFQFGRYLLICSSQPGGQPANLQGIWTDQLRPAWDSKYTVNINSEKRKSRSTRI